MEIGIHLVYALLAGLAFWFVAWLCGRLAVVGWLTSILSGAALVYVFWLLNAYGPVQIGQ